MQFKEFQKDLFTVPASFALAHCISADAEMGKGVAVSFDLRYPEMREYIQAQNPKVGDCILYVDESRGEEVLNLVTKKKYNGKPTYRTLEVAIASMHYRMLECGIRKVAMPAIGCGLDRLDWDMVKKIIKEELRGEREVKIAVCHRPKGFSTISSRAAR